MPLEAVVRILHGGPFLPETPFNIWIIKGPGSPSLISLLRFKEPGSATNVPSLVAGVPLPLSYFPVLLLDYQGTGVHFRCSQPGYRGPLSPLLLPRPVARLSRDRGPLPMFPAGLPGSPFPSPTSPSCCCWGSEPKLLRWPIPARDAPQPPDYQGSGIHFPRSQPGCRRPPSPLLLPHPIARQEGPTSWACAG